MALRTFQKCSRRCVPSCMSRSMPSFAENSASEICVVTRATVSGAETTIGGRASANLGHVDVVLSHEGELLLHAHGLEAHPAMR